GVFELFHKTREQLDVINVNLNHLLNPILIISMMCERMVGVRDAQFRIDAHTALAREHERGDARQICLERERQEVAHESDIFCKAYWNPGRLLDRWGDSAVLMLGGLYSLFDFTHSVKILVNFAFVGRTEFSIKFDSILADQIE